MLGALRQLDARDFPALLGEVPHAPQTLYLRGELPPLGYKYLCVVGTRRMSPYGSRMCSSLIAGLAGAPVAIVSGLAMGVDAEAHKTALDVGLPTLAVLPSGVNDSVIYPRMNRPLAERILKLGGGLLSENEPDFKAQLYSFPQRNRIMAGMSHATLVVEAGEKSGTLITAKLALDYNRDVLAVPHEVGRESGAGANRLLRDGATLIRSSDDLLEALHLPRREKLEQVALPLDLTHEELAIIEVLTEAYTRDEIIDGAGLSAQQANIALSSLLIRGIITERLGKIERI